MGSQRPSEPQLWEVACPTELSFFCSPQRQSALPTSERNIHLELKCFLLKNTPNSPPFPFWDLQDSKSPIPFWIPPGTKPIHAGKKSRGIDFCANTCGACIRTFANTGKYSRGIIFEICICTFAPYLCIDIVAVFTHPWCQYIKIFWGN